MKKKLLLIAAIVCTQLSIQAQNPVPNPGFENWTTGNPNNWLTMNITGMVTPVTQVSPGHSGNSAAKGQAQIFQTDTFPPFLMSTDQTGTGFPITQAYGNLSFWYKFNQASSDIFTAVVLIMDAQNNALGAGSIDFTNSVGSFTQAVVPISYISGGVAASAIIEFVLDDQNGNGAPSLTSYFIVDDVVLSGAAGIQSNNANTVKIVAYPQPATEQVSVNFNSANGKDTDFSLFELTGKKVADYQFKNLVSGSNTKTIDVKGLKNGVYILRSVNGEAMSTPVIVAH